MLWLDADKKRPFSEKVRRAVAYFREKYGRLPELVQVNNAALSAERMVPLNDGQTMKVEPVKTVLKDHFYLVMGGVG